MCEGGGGGVEEGEVNGTCFSCFYDHVFLRPYKIICNVTDLF